MTGIRSYLLCGALLATTPALADEAVTDCDRAAAYPDDPQRVAPGVTREQIDLDRALAACEADVAKQPANARLRYQLARVLFYRGQSDRAVSEMRAAADAGYAQAQFVFGTFVNKGREGAPTDICLTEQYWWRSAAGGRQAARVAYVRLALKGRFAACPHQATSEELADLLATAAGAAHDFYERLLIEDLSERLAAATTTTSRSHR